MFYQVLKIMALCLSVSLISGPSYASDSAEATKHEPAHGSAPAVVKRSSEESYSTVLGKVQALEAKVRSGEQEIEKLVAAKALAKSPQQVDEIIKSMLTLHHELKTNIQDYERQRSLLKYRYPEKSMNDGREYERLEFKSLEEMEGAASLSVAVRKTLKKVQSQYPDQDTAKEAGGVQEPKGRNPASEGPSLFDPVIMKK